MGFSGFGRARTSQYRVQRDGGFRHLSTKPILAGSGRNFKRHCHKMIFTGIGYKFNDFVQAVHRVHRFLQPHQCEIHIIHTEAERDVKVLMEKHTTRQR